MKIHVLQENLSEALSLVNKGISSKNTLEILKGILFETFDGKLMLTSNNLEIGVQTLVDDITIQRDGKIVIDAKIISDIVRKLPGGVISIDVDDHNIIKINAGEVEFNIKGFDAEDFPLPTSISEDEYREIDGEIFKDMIRKTSFAVSVDGDKPSFTGELMDIQSDNINIVAMDGFRLAIKSQKTQNQGRVAKILVPGKSIMEVSRMIQPKDKVIKLGFDEKHACFVIGDTIVTTRLLKNDFINYEQILPKEFTTIVQVGRTDFLNALERATLVSQKNLIKLNIKDEIMNISSKNDEIGNLNENIHIQLEGANLEIAFNSKFFMECLKTIDEEEVLLQFNTAVNPCILSPVDDKSYTYLVLPVRIS